MTNIDTNEDDDVIFGAPPVTPPAAAPVAPSQVNIDAILNSVPITELPGFDSLPVLNTPRVVSAPAAQVTQQAQLQDPNRRITSDMIAQLRREFVQRSLLSGIASVAWQFTPDPSLPGGLRLEDIRLLDDRDHELPLKPQNIAIIYQVLMNVLTEYLIARGGDILHTGRWFWQMDPHTVVSTGPCVNVSAALQAWYEQNPGTHPGNRSALELPVEMQPWED